MSDLKRRKPAKIQKVNPKPEADRLTTPSKFCCDCLGRLITAELEGIKLDIAILQKQTESITYTSIESACENKEICFEEICLVVKRISKLMI